MMMSLDVFKHVDVDGDLDVDVDGIIFSVV